MSTLQRFRKLLSRNETLASRYQQLLDTAATLPTDVIDCLVVGAGPAGLTAAIYLGRYLRSHLVVDGGDPRASWIPTSHNYPGAPSGTHGQDLLDRMRVQATEYGAQIVPGRVSGIQPQDGAFIATINGATVRARTVILCTGVINRDPVALAPGVKRIGTAQRLIRYCPICDGYEARSSKVAVIGSSDHGVAEALFIWNYTKDITVIPDRSPGLSEGGRKMLADHGIKVIDKMLTGVELGSGANAGRILLTTEDRTEPFDIMYPSLGSHCNTELAKQLGCEIAPDGEIITDAHQHTTVSGVYAAGDVVEGLDQIVIAEAQASIAATDVHNQIRKAALGMNVAPPLPNKGAVQPWGKGVTPPKPAV